MIEITQAVRDAAADLLDELSSILDHNGIRQVADLIRDSEYDDHEAVKAFAKFEAAAYTAGKANGEKAAPMMLEALEEAESVLGHVYNEVCLKGFLSDPSDRIVNALQQIRAAVAAAGGEG